jgi:hypothetical protein
LNPRPKILRARRLHACSCLGSYRARKVLQDKSFSRAILPLFRLGAGWRFPLAIPLIDAPIQPRGSGSVGRWLCSQSVRVVVCDYLYFLPINEQVETSACSPGLHIPVESVSPPYFELG